MAVEYNSYRNNAVVPKLPRFKMPYTPQQNTDPSAYYTKALGFLPIDTRYMVNTTNNLAYNSMADVLLNKAAWSERWDNSDYSWMNDWWAQNTIRPIVDTILLTKDTVIDPIAQGAIDDGWSGLIRGGSTALMNTLVNLGNTLDIVANPVKGLILEGGEGFVKGLVGDENGRKQYDYSEYIDTGDGVTDFVLSMAAEIISDPLNLVSFGGKALVKKGADEIAGAVTKSIKEVLEEAVSQGTKNIDELVPVLKNTKYTKSLTDETAKAILKDMAGESAEGLTKEAVDAFGETLQPLLKRTLSRAELAGGASKNYSKLAQDLAQSKSSRFKSSFLDLTAPKMTTGSQMLVSDYLKAATTVPDLLASTNKAVNIGGKLYRGAEATEKLLRQTAGLTGLTEAVYLTGQGARAAGWVRNLKAASDPDVLKTMDDVYTRFNKDTIDTAIKVLEENPHIVINKEIANSLYDDLSSYQKFLTEQTFTKKTIPNIQVKQQQLLEKINDSIKLLDIENVSTLDDYIKYLSDNNIVLKNTDVTTLVNELTRFNKMLSEDFTDKAVLKRYKDARLVKIDAINKQILSQGEAIKQRDKLYREFQRKYNDRTLDDLVEHDQQLDEVIARINNEELLDNLRYRIVPETLIQLEAEKVHSDIIDTFKQTWDDFVENLEKYNAEPNDHLLKDNAVQSYKSLNEQLNSFVRWDTTGGVTATNATQIKNLLGMPYLDKGDVVNGEDAFETLTKLHNLTEEEARVIIKEAELLQRLYNDPEYKEILSFYNVESGFEENLDEVLIELRNQKLTEYRSNALNLLERAQKIHDAYPDLPIIDTAPAKLYTITEADVLVLKEADAFLARFAADETLKELNKLYTALFGEDLMTALQERGAAAFSKHYFADKLSDEKLIEKFLNTTFPELRVLFETDRGYSTAGTVNRNVIGNILSKKCAEYLATTYGAGVSDLLKNANRIRNTMANAPVLAKSDLTNLYHLIEELPPATDIKSFATYVDPVDMRKYKLVIYSAMHQKNAFLHSQLDLEFAAGLKQVSRIHTGTRVTATFAKENKAYTSVADILDFFKRKNSLSHSYLVTAGVGPVYVDGTVTDLGRSADGFVNDVRRATDAFLKLTRTHNDVGDWFEYLDYFTLDSAAQSDNALAVFWKSYNDSLTKYNANPNSPQLKIELDNEILALKNYLRKHYDVSILKNLSISNAPLYAQALKLSNMTDEQIKYLATYDFEELYDKSPAYLAEFIAECDRDTSALNHILNDASVNPDTYDGQTIQAVKDLINRLKDYTDVCKRVAEATYNLGFDDTTVEAVLDALRTQLDKTGYVTQRHLGTIVDDVLDGANLHLQNRFETSSRALDRVFRQTVNTLSEDPNLPANYKTILQRISNRLDAGLAHGAVADVDNLTDLIDVTRARAVTDSRLVGMRKELLRIADGRNIIVFDIESTGANEAAAHIYQIAGKVLNANGKEIPNSKFNYIIRPPKDVDIKPTGLLLETLADKGEDTNLWWKNNIVDAESIEGVQTVFDDLDSALKAFEDHCSKQGSFILAGHNVNKYDIPALVQRASNKNIFLQNVDVFDTLKYMNNSIYQISDDNAFILKKYLIDILSELINNNSKLLDSKAFTYADVKTLIDFKDYIKSKYSDLFTFSKKDKEFLEASGIGYIDETTGKQVLSGARLDEGTAVGFDLEKTINGILEAWRSPAKLQKTKNNFFIVSKLNPDDLSKTMTSYFEELAKQGLINIAPGTNIMQYLNANVKAGHILINPVRVASYEVEEIFDLQKALRVYGEVKGFENKLNIKHVAELTRHYKYIQAKRNILPLDYVKHMRDTAAVFLELFPPKYLQALREGTDDLTLVAIASYVSGSYNTAQLLKLYNDNIDRINYLIADTDMNVMSFTQLKDVWNTVAEIRGYEDYTPTPILNELDELGVPKEIWGDTRFFSYDKVIDVLRKNPFNEIDEYNVGRNLYSVNNAAVHALYETLYNNVQGVLSYLNKLDETQRLVAERSLKTYNDMLDTKAITEIVTRADRVNALKNEMFMRGGYVVFETDSILKLDDFKADKGFVVVDNLRIKDDKYVHFICATKETLSAAEDLDIAAYVLKGIDGIDDTLLDYLITFRKTISDNGVKNIGYSHGDLIKETYIENIHSALRRAGISDEVIDTLPSVEDLTVLKFFNTPRANNSIIGGKHLWEYITNDSNVHIISDPFKQLLYSTKSGIVSGLDKLTLYCSLILNKHSSLTDADIFKIPDAELYKLLKDNPDFCMVYITKTGYWDNTKSGLIIKEFDLVNVKSVTRAREMGGVHIIPRTQAAQLMQSVNEFKLPPIARIAKSISDIYKVAYLGSLGFLVRNIIDSNYKTYMSLEGQVSLPKSISHFFQSITLVRKHTNIGQEYSKAMGKIFKSDLEYEVFYKYCMHYGDSNFIKAIPWTYDVKYQTRVTTLLNEFESKLSIEAINNVKANLIQPELFSIIDSFINHGPSAGLAKSILENIPSAAKEYDALDFGKAVNDWVTEKTPLKYVYGANDYIEQAARLSMFLQRLELGDTIDDANKAIIKAHFDYSDKSIGMLYTEILFPFMSFSYKNLNFWIEMMYSNPMLVGQMENIFRPILNYQGLFEPDQEAYREYDYTFDWSKDVQNHQSNMPWTMINAARLYHILNGNILIKTGEVEHDAGYGSKDNDLYTVFKLSPSVLDAVKMLYNPLNTYSERLLPPAETMWNIIKGLDKGEDVVEQMNIASLANMLPYADVIMQRIGIDEKGLRHNNIFKRVEDNGPLQLIGSVFGTAYVPQKDNVYYYDSDYNILGGFKQNYYAKRNYSNPYNSKYPSYTLTRMAQNKKPRDIYAKSKTYNAFTNQYNYYRQNAVDRILRYRVKDYYHYY